MKKSNKTVLAGPPSILKGFDFNKALSTTMISLGTTVSPG
jgi:hypothetical protein